VPSSRVRRVVVSELVRTGRATFILTSNFGAETLLLPDLVLASSPSHEDQGRRALERASRAASAKAKAEREGAAVDSRGRPNPFLRAELRGRIDAFADFFPYPADARAAIVEAALEKAVAPIERRSPHLQLCWDEAVVLHFAQKSAQSRQRVTPPPSPWPVRTGFWLLGIWVGDG
jgi:ATP-dependent Clp protease ATP-binding subunit ClpA